MNFETILRTCCFSALMADSSLDCSSLIFSACKYFIYFKWGYFILEYAFGHLVLLKFLHELLYFFVHLEVLELKVLSDDLEGSLLFIVKIYFGRVYYWLDVVVVMRIDVFFGGLLAFLLKLLALGHLHEVTDLFGFDWRELEWVFILMQVGVWQIIEIGFHLLLL